MQQSILLFFQHIATPALDIIAECFTLFGESILVMMICIVIYWCYDKKKGFAIVTTLLLALTSANIIKTIVKMPRPFTVIKGLEGKRLATATGYSFPSGHTTTAAATYGSIAVAFKKRGLSIVCALLIVLVGLSRLYLGVHWPTDVAGGLILGIAFSLYLYPLFYSLDDSKEASFLLIVGTLFLTAAVVLTILLSFSFASAIACSDLMKTLALGCGCFLGKYFDSKTIDFVVDGDKFHKVFRFLIGFGGLMLIAALKGLFPESVYYLGACIRYSLMGFWVTFLYPLIGTKVGLFNKR